MAFKEGYHTICEIRFSPKYEEALMSVFYSQENGVAFEVDNDTLNVLLFDKDFSQTMIHDIPYASAWIHEMLSYVGETKADILYFIDPSDLEDWHENAI